MSTVHCYSVYSLFIFYWDLDLFERQSNFGCHHPGVKVILFTFSIFFFCLQIAGAQINLIIEFSLYKYEHHKLSFKVLIHITQLAYILTIY